MDPPLSAPLSHAPNSSAAPSNISCNNPAVSNHNALSTAPAPRDSAPTPVPNIAANAPGFGLPPHFAFGPNFPSMTSGINIPPGYPSFPQAAPHPQNSIQPSPALPGPGSAAGMFYNYNASTAGTDLNSYNLSLFSNSAAATHFGAAAPFLSGASSSDPRGKHMPMNPTSYAPFSAPNSHQPNSDPAASGAGSSGTGSSASPTVAVPRQFSHPSQFSINAGGQGQLATGAGIMHAPPPAAPNSFAAWNDAYSSSSSHYLAGQQSGAFPPNMEPDFRFWTSYGDMSGQNQFWSAPWEMSSMGALSMASSLMPNYNYSSLPNHNLGFPTMGFMPTMMDPGMAVPSVLRDSSAGPVPMFDDSPEARALSAGQIPAYLTRPPTQSTQDSHASPIKHAAPSNFAQPHPSSHKQQQQQQQSEQPSQKQPNPTPAASNLVQFGSPFASVPMNLSEADSAHKSPPNGPFPSSERSPATTASASSRDISTTTLASDMSVSSDSFARHAPIRVNTTLPPLIPRSSSHHSLPFFGAGPSQDPVFYPPWAYPVISTSSSPNSSTSARSSAIDSNLTVPTEVPSAHSSGSSRTLRRSSASASVASAARPSAEVSEESPASKKRARSPVSAIVVTSGAPMLAKPVTDIPKGAPKVTVSAPASAASSPASSGSSVDVKTEPVEDTGGKPTKSKKRRAKRQRAQPALLSGKFVSPVVCGALRPGESSPHPSRIRMYSPFFKKSVAVYTALNDPRRRVLYQTTDLTRMLGCNNNMLAMYLNRRKSTPDSGIFQANTILHKSHSDKSVKIGGYFLSQPACEAFRVYYETSKGKIVTGSTAEEAKSPTELYQPPSPSASSDQTAKSAKEASSNSGAMPNSPSFDSALQLIASAASSLSVDSCPPSPTASSRAASSPSSEHQAAAAEANHRYTSSVSSVQSYGVSTGSSLSSTLTSFSSLATTAGSLASLLPSDPGSTSSSASSSSSSASSASSPVLSSAAAGQQPDHPAPAPSEVAADLSSSAAASSSVSSSLSSPTLHSNASETSSSDAAKKMQTE